MPVTATDSTPAVVAATAVAPSTEAERTFSVSILISATRCLLTYIVFPFLLPFLGLADRVGPALGLVIGVVAIAANVFSIRRFWRAEHRLRKPITAVHLAVIALLLVLVGLDISNL